MNEDNLLIRKYNKKYLVPVFSGTLAIEGALQSLNLTKDDKVLISSLSCYSILEAIIHSNLKPIIAIPTSGLLFEEKELKEIIKNEEIKVYIAVHQYGYYQNIPKVKDLIIIEDFSQAWNIENKNTIVGQKSDYLIMSLGKTKPLSNGIGGIILSDNDISNSFDLKNKDNRYNENSLLEYYYPNKINYKRLMTKANLSVYKQRKNAILLNNIFKRYKFVNTYDDIQSLPSYHRYVIGVNSNDFDKICSIFDKCKISFQKEYKLKLDELPITKKEKITVIGKHNEFKLLLIKANNSKIKIKKLFKEMEKEYGKKPQNNVC